MSSYTGYRFKSQDGLNLYARDYPCKKPQGSACKTLICIPGLTRNSADFAALSEHLTDRFRVIALDLRGRGKSDYDVNSENYHPGVYVQDVINLLDSLALDSVILIGTSLGGLVSIFLASLQPKRIAAAVINDIGPDIEKQGLDRIKKYVRNPPEVTTWEEAVLATRSAMAHEFPQLSDQDWEQFARRLFREDSNGTPTLDYDPMISVLLEQNQDSTPLDLWPVFSAIHNLPLLVVRGELSDILSKHCVEKMNEINTGMRYAEIPNCGHAPLLTEPESLVSINQFLDSL